MLFDFSPDQKLIAEQMATLFDRIVESADRRLADDALGECRNRLRLLAEAGVTTMLASEENGGLGLGMVEALAVMLEAGARLLPLPVAELMAGAAIMAELGHEGFEKIAAGECLVTTAWSGELRASREGAGLRLDGELRRVAFAGVADFVAANVRSDDRADVAVIDLRDPRVVIAGRDDFDPTSPTFSVILDGYAHRAAPLLDGSDTAARLATRGMILNAGDLCGGARRSLAATVEHARNRQQFGRPIGANQAIKHMASDAFIAIEHASAATEYAAWCMDADNAEERMAALVAIVTAGPNARKAAEDCIQIMGGLGYCREFDQHLYLKRALRCGEATGSARAHHERIASLRFDAGVAA